jgi:single-stranded-DNA-specific exonuclease
VGAVGDLGPAGFAMPECHGAPRAAVRRLAGLVNAARRVPGGPVRTALALLVEHESAPDALLDERVAALEEAKRAWKGELERVMRTPPEVGGDVALIRFSSPCQVHPLVATAWARRLAPRIVVAANDGYLPGRVSVAARGGGAGLPAQLRAALPGAGGCSLAPEDFERLLEATGLHAAVGA